MSPPAANDKKKTKLKTVQYAVELLDESRLSVSVDKEAKACKLFEAIANELNLLEVDYFDISHVDRHGLKKWLVKNERLKKQVSRNDSTLKFEVKFYPTDPSQLQEDLTRYLLCLQVHRNIVQGTLPCSFYTYALLGSYFVQAHLGDFDSIDAQEMNDHFAKLRFPCDQPDLLAAIKTMHKDRKGQTPAEAEMNYLENAKKLSMYGVELHKATSEANNEPVSLGIHAAGILVLADQLRLHRFAWQRIYKISYFRNHFNVLIHSGNRKATAKYSLPSTRHAKAVWKSCVAHHVFFRLMATETPTKHGLFKFGSARLEYPDRTQYQTRMASAASTRPPPRFLRSFRGFCRADGNKPPSSQQAVNNNVVDEGAQKNGTSTYAKQAHSPGSNSSLSSSVLDSEAHSVVIQTFTISESNIGSLRYDESNVTTAGDVTGLSNDASPMANANGTAEERRASVFSDKQKILDVPAMDTVAGELGALCLTDLIAIDPAAPDEDLALLKAIYGVTKLDPEYRAVRVKKISSSLQTETEV